MNLFGKMWILLIFSFSGILSAGNGQSHYLSIIRDTNCSARERAMASIQLGALIRGNASTPQTEAEAEAEAEAERYIRTAVQIARIRGDDRLMYDLVFEIGQIYDRRTSPEAQRRRTYWFSFFLNYFFEIPELYQGLLRSSLGLPANTLGLTEEFALTLYQIFQPPETHVQTREAREYFRTAVIFAATHGNDWLMYDLAYQMSQAYRGPEDQIMRAQWYAFFSDQLAQMGRLGLPAEFREVLFNAYHSITNNESMNVVQNTVGEATQFPASISMSACNR
jgi:hypothetical protein